MINHLLTDKELELLTELLENESKKLMRETRHIDARSVRKEVRQRLRTIDRLVERFQEVKAGDYAP